MPTARRDASLAWVRPKEDPKLVKEIMREFQLHQVTAQILVSRGFKTLPEIHDFLYSQLPDLHDPSLLQQMDVAVDRVCHAIKQGEGILVYGDNDVDGITGTTLLTEFIRALGGRVWFSLTLRNVQRDQIILDGLDYAKEKGCKLIITVDCGVTAASEIAEVRKEGIDVIVTDHHEVTGDIPDCVAVLNPKVPGNTYPNLDITGVGVAFKLAHGVTNRLVSTGELDPKELDLKQFLDLVALGTVSDMGALQGENRIFVRYGLKELEQRHRVGLAKLMDVCGVGDTVTTVDIASRLAPRINSLGRIADPRKGPELLLVKDGGVAERMAVELDLNNIERQRIERTASEDTYRSLEEHPEILENRAVVLDSDQWHPGVIAIVATRISKQYHRPTAIIAIEDGIGKGSVRSIAQFSLLDALRKCSDLLLNYGGHNVAAGLTIAKDNIPEFRRRFIELANEQLEAEDVLPKLRLDAAVDFPDLTFDFMDSLQLLEPHGNENPPPILYATTTQAWPPKVIGKSHLKLYLEQKDRILEAIGFGMADRAKPIKRKNLALEAAFTPQINVFHNKASIQLLLKDFREA